MSKLFDLLNAMIAKIKEPKSWNDLTDKPFGERMNRVELVAEKTYSFAVGAGLSSGALVNDFIEFNLQGLSLAEGDNVEWNIDGQSYICALKNASGNSGNKYLNSGSDADNTGEAFYYYGSVFTLYLDSSVFSEGEHTISCYLLESQVETLDPKYLPDDIGGGGGNVLRVIFSVSDSGSAIDTCDHTSEEISAVVDAGGIVYGQFVTYDGDTPIYSDVYHLYSCNSIVRTATFTRYYQSGASSVKREFVKVDGSTVTVSSV